MGSGLTKKRKYGSERVIKYPENPYIPGTKEHEYYRWCINNGIIIWPIGDLTDSWHIRITINGKTNISPEKYGNNLWDKVFEYYKYYYEKYKKE